MDAAAVSMTPGTIETAACQFAGHVEPCSAGAALSAPEIKSAGYGTSEATPPRTSSERGSLAASRLVRGNPDSSPRRLLPRSRLDALKDSQSDGSALAERTELGSALESSTLGMPLGRR